VLQRGGGKLLRELEETKERERSAGIARVASEIFHRREEKCKGEKKRAHQRLKKRE